MDYRGSGKGRKPGGKGGGGGRDTGGGASRYNVTPNPNSLGNEQMNQLLLQQFFLQQSQEQERRGGGGGGGEQQMAQAAAAAALFGGILGDKLQGGEGARGRVSERDQLQELLAAAAAANNQGGHNARSSSNTPSPSPRISSPHTSRASTAAASAAQSQNAAAMAASLQQIQLAAAALQNQGNKKDANNAAAAAIAAQQQWMYLDYLQRIQQEAQAQATQQQAQSQKSQRGRSNSSTNRSQSTGNLKGRPPQSRVQPQNQKPRNSTPSNAAASSASDLTRLLDQYTNPNANSLLKSSVLASAKLPADTEIIVQNNRSNMLQQLKNIGPGSTPQPHNKRGPKPKNPVTSTITSEQAKFEQQLINLGNNNAITITPANLDVKPATSAPSQAPITITPASIATNSVCGNPPQAHNTPFRYGNDKREVKLEEGATVLPAHKYVKELYTHVIPRKPQIGLIGPNRKAPKATQNQVRHHRPWIIEPNSDVIITPSNVATPPPLDLNKQNKKFLNIPKVAPEPIIISPPDYSIPIKDGWKREMILKHFDLGEENLSLACEVTYISPEGKVYSSLNEVKKGNIPDPKNFSFNSKIQLGRFVLPSSENCSKRFEYEELVDYFHERKVQEAIRKRNMRMKHEHNGYVKLLEAYRKNKRKLKLSEKKKIEEGGERRSNEVEELVDDVGNKLIVLSSVDGKKLNDRTFANLLQIHEFLHTFGETLGFDSESLPSLTSLQKAFLHVEDNEEELVSVLCHLLVCAVEDPGLPNPTGSKHLTPFGQTLKQADVTFGSMSEILRIYLNGISDSEPEAEEYADWLESAPFTAQSAYRKSSIVAFICDVLLQNKAVLKFLDNCSELIHNCKKEKQQNEIRVRKLRMLVARKQVAASIEEDGVGGLGGGTGSERGNGSICGDKEKEGGGEKEDQGLVSGGEDSMMMQEGRGEGKEEGKEDPAYAAVASVADSISSDPDSKLSIEELEVKMAGMVGSNEKLKKQMQNNSKSIRSVCMGQDRWRRRYWNLHFSGGIYVEGGATGEFEEVREAVKEKFEKNPPEPEPMEIDEQPPAPTSDPPPEDSPSKPSENGDILDSIKKEDQDHQETTQENIPPTAPQTPQETKRSTPFTVPPPVIKIFSFAPRIACSGRVRDIDEETKPTDDELLVKHVKSRDWYDWKCLNSQEDINNLANKLCDKGIREKNLKNQLNNCNFKPIPELKSPEIDHVITNNSDVGYVDPELLYKIHLGLIETLETLEERVASASLQVKGWVLPNRNLIQENLSEHEIIEIVKERVLDLENAVERRYLKPPLGKSGLEVNLTQLLKESEDVSYGLMLDGPIGSTSSTRGQQINENNKLKMELKERERLEKEMAARKEKEEGGGGKGDRFLTHWRDAITRTTSPSVLSMAIYILDSSIAWDKSVMKASCQLCKGGDNEDKLLLCDACDRGYHTYCFKPPLDNIPDGDWFCWECINKATGNKCCIVCGKGVVGGVKLLCCDKCVKAYHQDCIIPNVTKPPRGRWFCPDHREGTEGKGKITLSQALSVSMNTSDIVTPAPTPPSSSKKSSPKKKSVGGSRDRDGNVSDSSNSSSFVCIGNTTPAASSQESEGEREVGKGNRASTPVGGGGSSGGGGKKEGGGKKKGKKSGGKKEISVAGNGSSSGAGGGVSGIGGNGGDEEGVEEEGEEVKVEVKKEEVVKEEKPKLTKKQKQEMSWCDKLLDDLVGHEDAWPFLEPVNTRQFPTYKKIIKTPMDLQTIRLRLVSGQYKNKEAFLGDIRLIFDNCETFNEDDSPVGKAGHSLRVFFESKPGVGEATSSSGGGGGGTNSGK